MSSSRSPWASGDDYALFSTLAIILGGAVLSYMLWTNWHAQISFWYIRALVWQIDVLHLHSPAILQLRQQLVTASWWPDRIRAVQLWYGLMILGTALRWPVAIVIAALGVTCVLRAAPGRFAKALDLEGLIDVQARMFPTLRGFADRKLTKLIAPADGAPRPADPALHAGEWRARYATDSKGGFSEAGAISAFSAQLGRHWTGLNKASPVERVLFAVFSAHYGQHRAEAMTMLGKLSDSLRSAGLDGPEGPKAPLTVPPDIVAQADEHLASPGVSGRIEEICARNGWTTTALMTLLTEARRKAGVLAPPAFAIVKLIDRPLWYALHSLGFPQERPEEDVHPNPRVEAAGARAHWEAERKARRPIYTPAVSVAVDTIRPRPTTP
ncbi:hypothetical protein J2D73_10135 [Acetobacter sacchari]|uniref:DotM C-terminal cytoplasmic domain-containing protein n=1 Tax=Acetobacter sacchari TaxID=2661687 RepID=A0ABS3LW73_9PROT|nr:hypothetical protein [Acetobacter sacchari]MBO1360156.1 hypothetical protein [Acetobacter sacchari]